MERYLFANETNRGRSVISRYRCKRLVGHILVINYTNSVVAYIARRDHDQKGACGTRSSTRYA